MSTIQLQKTRTMPSTTETVMTQKQSLEIVQTLLLGGLSSLTYMREFFADKAYVSQFYENSSRIPSYKDYASCKLPPKKGTATGTAMQVLRRHRSKRADLFLDWLEKGAFAALKEANLHALQICVHLNADDREQVIETYTFTIKYHTDQQSGERIAGLEFGGSEGTAVTVEATSGAMQQMIRSITDLTEKLPSLPDERYVSMALFYTPDGEKKYEPQGFIPSVTNELRFANAKGWTKTTKKLDHELHSAYHSAILKVSYLHDPDLSDLVPTSYPAKLTYGYAIDAQTDIDTAAPQEADAETVVSQTPMQCTNSSTSTITQGHPSIDRLFDQMATPLPISAVPATNKTFDSPGGSEVDVDTQSSNVPRIKSALTGMMHPELLSQGDTQTQMSMRPPPPVSRIASRVPSRIPNSPIQDKLPTAKGPPLKEQPWASDQMTILPKIAKELTAKQPQLRETALSLAKTTASQSVDQDIVLCQCGHDKDDETVYCLYCGTWQHLHCYGYSGASDPRLPEDHVCYQCLLGGRDEETLTKVKQLAFRRRGMTFVLQGGLRRKTELAKTMGVDAATGNALFTQLRAYTVNAQNSHKPGFAATNKAPWVPAQPGHPNHDRMLRELFDPVTHIEKYYATRPILSKPITQQLLALRTASMPPPSTPASVFNKKRQSATPGDGLDIRASMTPYETPMRMPTAKRLRDEEEFDSPAKRHASTTTPLYERLRSVQSSFILNADGKNSSPAGRN